MDKENCSRLYWAKALLMAVLLCVAAAAFADEAGGSRPLVQDKSGLSLLVFRDGSPLPAVRKRYTGGGLSWSARNHLPTGNTKRRWTCP